LSKASDGFRGPPVILSISGCGGRSARR